MIRSGLRFGLLGICWVATIAQSAIAPSSQLFGSSNLSTTAIRSSLSDINAAMQNAQDRQAILTRLIVLQNAVDDWAANYPGDPAARRSYKEVCDDMAQLGDANGARAAARNCTSAFQQRFP